MGNGDYVGDPYGCAKSANSTEQWRQREWNCGGDAEGIKEQLQGIKSESPFFIGRQRWRYRARRESLCRTSGTRFKRKFMRKWRQLRLTDTVFVSLFEIIEASRRVHRFSSLRYRLACDDRNLTNSAGDIRYSVPVHGWPNIDAHMLPKAEKRLCTFKSPLHGKNFSSYK